MEHCHGRGHMSGGYGTYDRRQHRTADSSLCHTGERQTDCDREEGTDMECERKRENEWEREREVGVHKREK